MYPLEKKHPEQPPRQRVSLEYGRTPSRVIPNQANKSSSWRDSISSEEATTQSNTRRRRQAAFDSKVLVPDNPHFATSKAPYLVLRASCRFGSSVKKPISQSGSFHYCGEASSANQIASDLPTKRRYPALQPICGASIVGHTLHRAYKVQRSVGRGVGWNALEKCGSASACEQGDPILVTIYWLDTAD